MARISLKCACGWNFFVAGSIQGHETACPNCGDAVRIPGRTASSDGPKAPGVLAAEKQAKQKLVVLLVCVAAGVLLVGVVLLVVTGRPSTPVEADDGRPKPLDMPRPPRLATAGGPSGAPVDGSRPAGTRPEASGGPNREGRVEELRKGIRMNVWRLNLAAIASESLRLRGHAEGVTQLEERMKTWEAKIAESLTALLELGDRLAVEAHARAGDRLVGFASKNIAELRPSEADQNYLAPWLRAFRAAQPLEQAVLQRGSDRIELYLMFPEAPEELLGIARLPDVAGPGKYADPVGSPAATPIPSPGPASLPAPGGAAFPIPPATLKEVEARFQALPPGYKTLLPPADRTRLDAVLAAKSGLADDFNFLNTRILQEALPAFEREAALVLAKATELEGKLKETTAVDVVHFKDGRKVSGQVLEQNEQVVKIKARLGSMTVQMTDVAKVERGKGAGLEYPAKLAAAGKAAPELSKLLAWCGENNLKLEAEYTACLILALDPLHEKARASAGLPARPPLKSSGAAPASGPAPLGAGPGVDLTTRAVDLLAGDIVRRYTAFGDVIAQMRGGTAAHRFPTPPLPPARSARAASLIQDPLIFELTSLDASAALEVGQWWGALPAEDRRDFARYFGLACAYQRKLRSER